MTWERTTFSVIEWPQVQFGATEVYNCVAYFLLKNSVSLGIILDKIFKCFFISWSIFGGVMAPTGFPSPLGSANAYIPTTCRDSLHGEK